MDVDINQAPEAQAFLKRVAALPKESGASLDPVLAPSVEQEAELRRLFAQDRTNSRLANPYVGLISVFEASEESGMRSSRARVVKNKHDLAAKYVFPVPDDKRRMDFEPSVVGSLEEFQRNWAIFTEGSLSQLTDWNNVIAAGGSVLACLLPLDPADKESRRTTRKFYHSTAYPTSDIDLFLWGLTPEQAEVKINQIFEAVCDSVPWHVTCVRTRHAISIHSQYPYRSVQIVLRLYHSPAEVLAGFDVDAPCVAYDGSRILANPRSIVALTRQANTVDVTRRSPSYEIRLAKYASRGFEVYVPDLRRSDIDPTIFERSLSRITGLARLLVLEKLAKPETRMSYLESRRNLRSRVKNKITYTRRIRRKRKGDLKAEEEIAGLDMNDYDVASLHIPYGPATFNPKNKNRRLHRHNAFFGTMKECIEDLCEYCPEPRSDEEKALQEEEGKQYIRGRISFIEEDPGRQSMTGSFNPINIGEWSELAYVGPTEKFFAAIAANDQSTVQSLLASGEVDVNRRDHIGHTALQLAVLCGAADVCAILIDAGVRMTARLADGRTALHMAAQMDMPAIVEKMLVRSTQNYESAKEEKEARAKAVARKGNNPEDAEDEKSEEESDWERPSSEDDWSSEEDDKIKRAIAKNEDDAKSEPDADADIPEDNVELPDVLDINLTDWDLAFTPLDYAIISGSKGSIQALLNAGADPKLATKAKDYSSHILHPLYLTALIQDDACAEEVIDQLLRAGASSAQADECLFSVFHALVLSGRTCLVEKILRSDPTAAAALNVPFNTPTHWSRDQMVYPLVSAVAMGFYSVAYLLLGYGAIVSVLAQDVQKAKNMIPIQRSVRNPYDKTPHELDYLGDVFLPVETALAYQNYMAQLLVKLGAQVSVPVKAYFDHGRYAEDSRTSLVECVARHVRILNQKLSELEENPASADPNLSGDPKTFMELRKQIKDKLELFGKEGESNSSDVAAALYVNGIPRDEKKRIPELRCTLIFFEEMDSLLKSVDAKKYEEIFADYPDAKPPAPPPPDLKNEANQTERTQYRYISKQSWGRENVLPHLLDQYDALFQACWTGDNSRIEELCLPRKSRKSSKLPIRIAVQAEDSSSGGAHTPFSVAILSRKWDTARVILAIATAQYKPKEVTSNAQLIGQSFVIDGDSDSDSDVDTICDSDNDKLDADRGGVVTITDLAARDSAVRCDVSPKFLVNASVSRRVRQDGKSVLSQGSIITQACNDGDLEASVNIYDMMQQLPEPQEPDLECMFGAIRSDSPELVDEIIRRTGIGADLGQVVTPENDGLPPENPSRLYLGLTVHGKKREDLARYVDGNLTDRTEKKELPLFWQAIEHAAQKVIEYLSGCSGPLAAYRYYAMTKSNERAEALRRCQDLDKQLPRLLGITVNSRGVNALTAVILAAPEKEKLTLAKRILALFPSQKFLQSSLAFTGWTPLHLAAAENLEPDFFDFLFANGLSAEETDKRGINIYHFVCRLGHVDLLKYFLKKLPHDVSSRLLKQTTKKSGVTPIMTAVNNSELEIVQTLLRSGLDAVKDCLTMRDAGGSMPLHAAVRNGFAKITSLLIGAAPVSEAFHCENGVGETPLETAWSQWLIYATHAGYPGDSLLHSRSLKILDYSSTIVSVSGPPDAQKLTKEIGLLKTVREALLRDGKLTANPKLKDALDEFLPYLAGKVDPEAKSNAPSLNAQLKDKDQCDYAKTLEVMSAAVSAAPGQRRLVHLTDVQRSVRWSLEKANGKPKSRDYDDYQHRYKPPKVTMKCQMKMTPQKHSEREVWNGIVGRSQQLFKLVDNDEGRPFV